MENTEPANNRKFNLKKGFKTFLKKFKKNRKKSPEPSSDQDQQCENNQHPENLITVSAEEPEVLIFNDYEQLRAINPELCERFDIFDNKEVMLPGYRKSLDLTGIDLGCLDENQKSIVKTALENRQKIIYSLTLQGCNLQSPSIIPDLKGVTKLIMDENPDIFKSGGKLPISSTIKTLQLNNCGISEETSLQLHKFPSLKFLDIGNNVKIDHSQLETLLKSKLLFTLFIKGSNITGFPFKSIFDFSSHFDSLVPGYFLDISNNPELDLPKEGPMRYLLAAAVMCNGFLSKFNNTKIDKNEVEKYHQYACNILKEKDKITEGIKKIAQDFQLYTSGVSDLKGYLEENFCQLYVAIAEKDLAKEPIDIIETAFKTMQFELIPIAVAFTSPIPPNLQNTHQAQELISNEDQQPLIRRGH
jgi:hypothetical protein